MEFLRMPVKSVENWTSEDVSIWLNKSGLEKYSRRFKYNRITGRVLLTITENDLRSAELKFNKSAIRKFQALVEQLKLESNGTKM